MGFPHGYVPRPDEHTPITGGKVPLSNLTHGIVARGIWKKPKLNLNWLRRTKIKSGGHGEGESGQACIMEAFSVATGQRFGAEPICVSSIIIETLIDANDTRQSDRDRARLKKVVPLIMGTAPIRIRRIRGRLWEEKDTGDKAYLEVEGRRNKAIDQFKKKHGLGPNDYLSIGKIKTSEIITLVEKLARMKPKTKLKRPQPKAARKVASK